MEKLSSEVSQYAFILWDKTMPIPKHNKHDKDKPNYESRS